MLYRLNHAEQQTFTGPGPAGITGTWQPGEIRDLPEGEYPMLEEVDPGELGKPSQTAHAAELPEPEAVTFSPPPEPPAQGGS
ncbi:MAG: hypothetical protein NVS1B16_11310 [Pseudarthrobacter sp.]